MPTDAQGHAVTLSNPLALEPFERAMAAFRSYRGDPLAPLDEALAIAPDFAMASIAKALILMSFFERRFARDAAAVLDAAGPWIARATPREKALADAARRLAEGDWHGGTAALEAVMSEHPRDILALQVAHLMDFLRGDSLNLRNRISRVLPHWDRSIPGYAYVLGMHAFGFEECNQYPEAEATGLRALALEPSDGWAVHAVTHVMEMQGRIDEGIAFLRSRESHWAPEDNGFAFHNWWHLALFHLDRGENGETLAIYDRVLAEAHAMALSRLDATALLWRLALEGVDVGSRFEKVADAWAADLQGEAGFYAFNDFHAAMAFGAAGRLDSASRIRAVMEASTREEGANAVMALTVGIDAAEAMLAFGEGRYDRAIERLQTVRDIAVRFGGSHAQRDVLSLTLIEAARRAGRPALAAHYAAERTVHKPDSRWGWRLLERAQGAARPSAPVARAA